jgi:hypothetical protein
MKKFTEAVDVALSKMAEESLQSSWDVENADKEELLIIANSLGLHPQPYMDEDILRKYIRSFGTINRLKGTDTLITYLVEKMTHFKVLEISVDEENNRLIRTKVLRDVKLQAETEERILDFLIPKYTKLLYSYLVAYVNYSESVWSNPITTKTNTITRSQTELINFHHMKRFGERPFELMPFGNEQVPELLNFTSQMNQTSNSIMELVRDVTDTIINLSVSAVSKVIQDVTVDSTRAITMTTQSTVENFGTNGDIYEMKEKLVFRGQFNSIVSDFPSISFRTPFELQTL